LTSEQLYDFKIPIGCCRLMKISLPIGLPGDIDCFFFLSSRSPLMPSTVFQSQLEPTPRSRATPRCAAEFACAHRERRGRIRSAFAVPYTASFKGPWHDQPHSRNCTFASAHCLRPAMTSTHGNQQTSQWVRCHRLSRPFPTARAAVVAVAEKNLVEEKLRPFGIGNQSRP
jgi:hypothetical protein